MVSPAPGVRPRIRSWRRWPRLTTVLSVVAASLLAWRLVSARSMPDLPPIGRAVYVVRVIDGDTIELEGGFRVRLLGVNTPETKHPELLPEPWGREAFEFTRSRVEGRAVWLELDQERWDNYRRVLAYVYVGDLLLNEEIVRRGFSRAITSFPIRSDRKRLFTRAEEAARAAQCGLWSPTPPPVSPEGTADSQRVVP
ncbi:MAG: hypothetical protein DWH91_04105 [Planctomycetota bacterium]|nr:MAG: hypothetical protein DWH91_04105 [Planctomycetota bacterium]